MSFNHQLVPEFIYEKYRIGTAYGSFQGAAMFADLSGFSSMTDALSAHGAHGAEVLADMMRVVFEPLVNAVYMHGGFVIGFAGDAFNAIFPVDDSTNAKLAARHCLAAAWAMQAHAKSHPLAGTPYGDFPIRIKVGIGFGATTWQIFKSISGKRASYWFRGQSLNGAVDGEECAHAGDVVADPLSLDLLREVVKVTPAGNCFLIQDILTDLPAPSPVPPPKPADVLLDIFFAESIAHLPTAGEFRQVVNLFIDIPASISDETLIRPFMETVYLLQEKYGGFFLRPDLGDKGFNLLMFWGAPTAYENDVDRALNFILELSTRTGILLRAGISYHMAYAGFIGSHQREDYTAYGWGVTLAARMMERAGAGEYWMDEEASRRAAKHFNLKPLGAHRFKGFRREQKVFMLSGRRNLVETVYQGQLVGRDRELETLASFVEPLRRGQFAGAIILKGEAGIGKSRLLHSFQYSRYFQDLSAHWALCQADEILRLPFNPFTDWLRKRFGVIDGQPDEVNLIQFAHVIRQLTESATDAELAAELKRTCSVLAALVNLTPPDSLYESLDAKGRYENTLIALSVLLRIESLREPLILFLEDAHWFDKDTSAFLDYFMQTLLAEPEKQYPIAIIATQRPEGDFAWSADFEARVIHLDKLTRESISQLAADILSRPAANSLLALLDSRADGNPFFAEQILRYLSERGALKLNTEQKYFADTQVEGSLPTDVRAVLIARLDRLTRQVRETVQTASVLGREFEVRVLGEMLRADPDFLQHLRCAENANIWVALTEIQYIFRHALLRDAAYSMQLLARQRELHGLAVSAMETVYCDDLEPHYGVLAYHAEKANIEEKALRYLTLAGKFSLGVYQNQQAIDYFTRALPCLPKNETKKRFDILFERAEAYSRVSDFEAQSYDLDALETLTRNLNLGELTGRVLAKRAYYFSSQGDYQNALFHANEAKKYSETARDNATLLDVYMVIQAALMRTGRIAEAVQYAKTALAFAEQTGDRRGVAAAWTALGLASLESEGPATARHHQEQALLISREVKDRYLEAKVLNNLANVVTSLGDFSAARDYFSQSFAIFQEHGDLSGKGLIWSNLGWLAGTLGDYQGARKYYQEALLVTRKVGNRMEEMYTYINLSATEIALGLTQDALALLERALELSEKIGDRTAAGWVYFYRGRAYLTSGELDFAVSDFLKSIEIRKQVSTPALIMESRAGLCEAYLKLGSLTAAQGEAEKVLAYAAENRTFEGTEEPLQIFLSMLRFLDQTKDPRSHVVLQSALQLLEAQVSRLPEEEARRMFVENVPWRRAIWRMGGREV